MQTKPHGHGDVHTLLASSGLARRWADEGRKYVVFFQDTNALCFTATTSALGVSVRERFEVNSITIPRMAGEAVGAITRLVKAGGESITVNVEYNQLEPLLKATVDAAGDVNDPSTGYSPYPGNINQLIFSIPEYARASVPPPACGALDACVSPCAQVRRGAHAHRRPRARVREPQVRRQGQVPVHEADAAGVHDAGATRLARARAGLRARTL